MVPAAPHASIARRRLVRHMDDGGELIWIWVMIFTSLAGMGMVAYMVIRALLMALGWMPGWMR